MENPIKLVNESANKFVDISSELWRIYEYFTEGHLEAIMIDEPCWLAVSTGGHRVLDSSGICHYIPKGWKHLKWKPRAGEPHFVK